jgi:AmmeMemoRadiSam system protein A
MQKLKLNDQQKKAMIEKVHAAIEQKLFGKSRNEPPSLDDEVFSQQYGLFVTLTISGGLRGCIGYVEGVKPLREAVEDMALQAAFHDPRFYPLKKEEYDRLKVEISILYPVEKVDDFEQIEVGRDGLIMERGMRKGLLLPQVASDHGWDRERFMNETCRKAGLESFCWENGATVYKFEAEVFNEDDLGS